jgi:serine/threonine protein phosphatase PrpC
MQCPKCQAINAQRSKYCEECGASMADAGTQAVASPTSANAAIAAIAAVPVGTANSKAPLMLASDATLALVSDVGRQYPVNQDNGCVGKSASGAVVMVVADGVSSADRAEIASEVASKAAFEFLTEAASTPGFDAMALMRQAVACAHEAVLALPWTNKTREEPETTIVCALVAPMPITPQAPSQPGNWPPGMQATIGWVGDSRAYLLAGAQAGQAGQARIVTRDDSWLLDTIDEQSMSLEAALADRRSHAITQCLGMRDDEVDIHVCQIPLQAGQTLLLCTDGLWNYFNDAASMAHALQKARQSVAEPHTAEPHTADPANAPGAPGAPDALALCRQLTDFANAAGGRDNITVALYQAPLAAPSCA